MLRQLRFIRLPLVGTLLLGLVVGLYMMASRSSAKPDPSNPITKHRVDNPSDEALRYWTKDRMRKAKPAEMPHVNPPDAGKERPSHESDAHNAE